MTEGQIQLTDILMYIQKYREGKAFMSFLKGYIYVQHPGDSCPVQNLLSECVLTSLSMSI